MDTKECCIIPLTALELEQLVYGTRNRTLVAGEFGE